MTTALLVEEESGTSTGLFHPHNGYYAGDFSGYAERPEGAAWHRPSQSWQRVLESARRPARVDPRATARLASAA